LAMTCSCWFPRSPRKLLLSRLLNGQPLGSSTKQVCIRPPEEPGRHLRRPYAVWLFVLATIQAPLNPVFASLHLKPRPWQFQVGAESWRVAGLIVDDTFYLVWLDEKHAHCTRQPHPGESWRNGSHLALATCFALTLSLAGKSLRMRLPALEPSQSSQRYSGSSLFKLGRDPPCASSTTRRAFCAVWRYLPGLEDS
jgi:hypothetical protein